jgi:hypothetical protein
MRRSGTDFMKTSYYWFFFKGSKLKGTIINDVFNRNTTYLTLISLLTHPTRPAEAATLPSE